MRTAIVLLTAGMLTACGQSAGNGAAANGSAASDGGAPATGGGAAGAMVQMEPGEWEVSITLPAGGQMPGTRICITPQDVAQGAAAMLNGGGRQQQGINCDYSGVTMAGGRIQGTSTCTQAEGTTISVTMDGTMSPTAYDVNQRMRTTVRGQTRETEAHMTGRRIGECQAGQRPAG